MLEVTKDTKITITNKDKTPVEVFFRTDNLHGDFFNLRKKSGKGYQTFAISVGELEEVIELLRKLRKEVIQLGVIEVERL